MFHFGSTSIESNYLAVASYMEQERKNMQKMLDIYSKKCIGGEFFKGKKEYQVKKFLDTKFRNKGDWYLDANEAKYYGFIDGIIGQDYKLKEI
jgi:ATP-dependent protease ClpP protease subunit